MLATKRYEYLKTDVIQVHPDVWNHRPLDRKKVAHYAKDIQAHGLLEPLVVWEKSPGAYFLIGGFHRLAAIQSIRRRNPDFFNRVDARVVTGEINEMRALTLKLNADRVDTKITDFFDTIIHLNNANWEAERIAQFIDRSVSWVEDIIRYAPILPEPVRKKLETKELSWEKAKRIARAVRDAKPGTENAVLAKALKAEKKAPQKRPLTFKVAKSRLAELTQQSKKKRYSVNGDELLSLILVLEGRHFDDRHVDAVKKKFPGLL